MRRTQLYLDDSLWQVLHARARARKTTISELAREAIRERYLSNREDRRQAMRDFIGIRKDVAGEIDAVEYVRELRRGSRLERLNKS